MPEDSYHTAGAAKDRAKTWRLDAERNAQLKRIADGLERFALSRGEAQLAYGALQELKFRNEEGDLAPLTDAEELLRQRLERELVTNRLPKEVKP